MIAVEKTGGYCLFGLSGACILLYCLSACANMHDPSRLLACGFSSGRVW